MTVWSERLEKKLQDYTAYHTGFDDGKDEGIEIGIEQDRKEIVINMNKRKVPKDLISQYTNLSIEEVEGIIQIKNV